jgi:CRISPR-associated protein Csh2
MSQKETKKVAEKEDGKTEVAKIVDKNEEFLFIYDAEMCNPNGDPDNENKPRMDMPTLTNIVTDVRMKRYIRDYLEQYEKQEIYVSNPEGIVLNASDRLRFYIWRKSNPDASYDSAVAKKVKMNLTKDDVLKAFIDTRLFGATIPIKGDDGGSIKFIGPVQLNWGKSFNEVELVDTNGITSHFSSGEGSQGTMGTDYRVFYSLIGFHGILSAARAKETTLTTADIDLLDKAFIKSIPLLATRSKVGQYPRFYMRINYNKNDIAIGDFRKFIKLSTRQKLRKFSDFTLDFTELFKKLEENVNKIEKIVYWVSPELKIGDIKDPLKAKMTLLNV